jgi:hypothetical protein
MKRALFAVFAGVLMSASANARELSAEFQAKLNTSSSAELKTALFTTRASYIEECGVGAVLAFGLPIVQVVPVIGGFPVIGAADADEETQTNRMNVESITEPRQYEGSLGAALGGWVGGAIFDVIEGAIYYIHRSANLSDTSGSFAMNASKISIGAVRANYTRLIGKNSGCQRSLYRASILRNTLLVREKAEIKER